MVRVGTGRSYKEAAGSSPNASGGYSPDEASAADRSPDAAPATATIGYTTPVFDKDAFQDGVNKCDLDLMLKKVKLDEMRMQTEKNNMLCVPMRTCSCLAMVNNNSTLRSYVSWGSYQG